MSFDATVAGTSAATWASHPRLAGLAVADLPAIDHLVVVAAHPDDETLGAGGIAHRAARRGIDLHVVIATDGSASHPESPTTTAAQLAATRRDEVTTAAALLAPTATVHWLGLPDGGIDERRAELRAGIDAVLAALAGRVLILATWRGDRHRDHRVVGEVCVDLGQVHDSDVLEYPVWMWHWGEPGDDDLPWSRMRRVELDDEEQAAKNAAIAAHVSQIAPLSDAVGDEAMLRPDFVEHFRGAHEVVIVPENYFDGLYARHRDPWGYATRWYEERKRALTLGTLRRQRYGRALELGCSTGMLTRELGARVDEVVALDAAPAAVERARRATATLSNVTIEQRDVRAALPAGPFDLVILGELGYYLREEELAQVLRGIVSVLAPDGDVVLCHWRHPAAEFRLTGDRVHEIAAVEFDLHHHVSHLEPDLRLDLYSPAVGSVASWEGLA